MKLSSSRNRSRETGVGSRIRPESSRLSLNSMASRVTQFVQLVRSTKREKRLGTIILFVTSRCNSFCQTCFYHEELNRPGDMTFAQIEKVSRTMPPITDLWLSGGEPTLRHDVLEIVATFVRNNGVQRLIIPTNVLIKSRVF